MPIFSIVNKFTDAVGLTDFKGQKKAAQNAANVQLQSLDDQKAAISQGFGSANDQLQPYAQLGQDVLPQFSALLTPQGQQDYLSNNPMFSAALNNANQETKSLAAAQGRLQSGDTVSQLFSNYMAVGNNSINSQFNRLLSGFDRGFNASSAIAGNAINQGQSLAGIYGGQGNVRAGEIAAQQQVDNASANFNLQALMMALKAASGGGGVPGGIPSGGL